MFNREKIKQRYDVQLLKIDFLHENEEFSTSVFSFNIFDRRLPQVVTPRSINLHYPRLND